MGKRVEAIPTLLCNGGDYHGVVMGFYSRFVLFYHVILIIFSCST